MRKLILIRGLPGSGKSTLAEQMAKAMGAFHFEADQYFIDENGEYKFDAGDLGKAHAFCLRRTDLAMERKDHDIIVSNTFTQQWEMDAYFGLAVAHNYQVVTLIVENRHGSKSVHNVPTESIAKMKKRFEVQL